MRLTSETTEENIENNTNTAGLQIVKESEEDRLMTLSVGPQHPGSGHFRFTVKVDGDYIVHCDPDPGYVHRGEEKMCDTATLFKIFLILNVRLYTIPTISLIPIASQLKN